MQLISKTWLCPLLQFAEILRKQASDAGMHGMRFTDMLHVSSAVLCKKIPDSLILVSIPC